MSTKFSLQLWDLRRQIDKLVDYIKLKIEQKDWHGVSDAANDIRELEAKIETYKELETQ
jgi:hypothetical protein